MKQVVPFTSIKKKDNQPSLLKAYGYTGGTLVPLLASIRRTWRQQTTFGDDTTFVRRWRCFVAFVYGQHMAVFLQSSSSMSKL